MSENELPPLGARVRVTYEGTVIECGNLGDGTYFTVEGTSGALSFDVGRVAVEILAPSLHPEPEGDVVVLDRMGELWWYGKGAWRHQFRPQKWAELVAAFGPLTVYRAES